MRRLPLFFLSLLILLFSGCEKETSGPSETMDLTGLWVNYLTAPANEEAYEPTCCESIFGVYCPHFQIQGKSYVAVFGDLETEQFSINESQSGSVRFDPFKKEICIKLDENNYTYVTKIIGYSKNEMKLLIIEAPFERFLNSEIKLKRKTLL